MKWILKMRPWVLVGWMVIAILSAVTMPSIDKWIREKGQPQPAAGYSSRIASDLMKELNNNKNSNSTDALVVFHNSNGLQLHMQSIKEKLHGLDKEKLKIYSMLTPFENKKLKNQLISKDNTTIMALITLEKGKEPISELRGKLAKELKMENVETYLTGKDFISEDYARTTVSGVKNTELFAVFIIFAILIIVFRSLLTPIISLLTVGLTYLVSLGIVMHLVEKFNFPFSSATQIFLILVLFGIGTDYTILLFMRFKKELLKTRSISEAILQTYKTAGKTVFFSGLAILIGFSMLGFSQFTVYQSGVAVSFGIIFLLIALFTITPVFMSVSGKLLFWPTQEAQGHPGSRIWSVLGNFSMKRPLVSIFIIALISLQY